MKLEDFNVSWFDFVPVVLVLVGVLRGRKRGMSEELLDTFKWLLIVVAAGFAHAPLGDMLAESTMFSPLACHLATYAGCVLFVFLVFSFIRHRVGEKLIGSDVFGAGEYYLGMMAGAFRYVCVLIVALSFLGARQYTAEEVNADRNFQQNNFGDIRFPTLAGLQNEVFGHSLTGALARDYLSVVLIQPTVPTDKAIGSRSVVRARERDVNEILEKR